MAKSRTESSISPIKKDRKLSNVSGSGSKDDSLFEAHKTQQNLSKMESEIKALVE